MIRMIKSFGMAFFISLLFLISAAPIHRAGECTYGSVHARFRMVDGDWENATAHPMLKRGESFEIKIIVRVKTNLRVVYLKLHEFGTPVYEVITGPSTMEQLLEHWGPTQSDQSWTYVWKMRVKADTSWVNGFSPLEVYVQFTKSDDDDSSITFDVMNTFIIDELWENYPQETINENFSSQTKDVPMLSSSSFLAVIIILFLAGVFLRGRRQR
jgi:sarcinarray family protein